MGNVQDTESYANLPRSHSYMAVNRITPASIIHFRKEEQSKDTNLKHEQTF